MPGFNPLATKTLSIDPGTGLSDFDTSGVRILVFSYANFFSFILISITNFAMSLDSRQSP